GGILIAADRCTWLDLTRLVRWIALYLCRVQECSRRPLPGSNSVIVRRTWRIPRRAVVPCQKVDDPGRGVESDLVGRIVEQVNTGWISRIVIAHAVGEVVVIRARREVNNQVSPLRHSDGWQTARA